MTGFGSKSFTDPDTFGTHSMEADIRLVVTDCVEFGAHVSWLDMRCLRLFMVEEKAPRIAFISLPASPLSVSFPLADTPPLVWNGIRCRGGRSCTPGDRSHQRTTGATRWA